ncbi:hypothetical protein M199_gp106 [Halogranum tailed virus 1]|uniref:Uncharacterized protein n=1 Tax=Halogranum tailed virus 1 TaxID=1273749 RepID=R4T9F6_9CAUD|nr:hypothetical protein M199_gp106 [Halogranum tailed virus 1]AGM11560.1 hypothetical protein HGTV1_263 [Halogranum tailed virus 1]
MRERLTADEVRNVEEGEHLVVHLHEDEYWMMGEGKVQYVSKEQNGDTRISLRSLTGHSCTLKVPSDARAGLRFDGAARGSRNLRVKRVESKGL